MSTGRKRVTSQAPLPPRCSRGSSATYPKPASRVPEGTDPAGIRGRGDSRSDPLPPPRPRSPLPPPPSPLRLSLSLGTPEGPTPGHRLRRIPRPPRLKPRLRGDVRGRTCGPRDPAARGPRRGRCGPSGAVHTNRERGRKAPGPGRPAPPSRPHAEAPLAHLGAAAG